eukprot:527185-Hanusia_phi.AAC.1
MSEIVYSYYIVVLSQSNSWKTYVVEDHVILLLIASTAQADDDLAMFSGLEQLKFDEAGTDRVTDSEPAFATFGNEMSSGVQKVGVRVLKRKFSLFVGILSEPRSPSKPCWADTLRTPAVMVGKGGRSGQMLFKRNV